MDKKPSIWQYLTSYRSESFAAPILKMAEASFELLVPLVVAKIVDEGIISCDMGIITRCVLLMAAFAVAGTLFAVVAQYFSAKAATGFASDLRSDLFKKIQTFSHETLDALGTGALLTRMNSDINAVQNAVNLFLRLFLRSPFIVVGACIMAITVDAGTSLLFFAVVVVLGAIVFFITKSSLPVFANIQKKLEELTLTTRESMEGAKVIRAFSMEKKENTRFCEENEALYSTQKQVARLQSILSPATTVVINAGIVVLLYVTGLKVNSGNLTTGATIALLNYMGQILIELIKIANLIVLLTKAVPCVTRLNEVMFLPSEDADTGEDASLAVARGSSGVPVFSVRNLGFTYNMSAEESLDNISFDIFPGETIGIIGGTGAGKTTLLELLCGSYQATSGSIEFYGQSINTFSRKSYKKLISHVPQRAALFSGSVASNLRVADTQAQDDRLNRALDVAEAYDFVMEKGGLDAGVLSGGSNFSGGQRQRLTIARALTRKAPVYVFDDSFSALDMATEKHLAEKLRDFKESMNPMPVMIIVSQRASSLRFADRILVLEDGKADAFGTKEELLETSEIFREIYRTQYETDGRGGAA